jgi:hypothetical protein
MPFNTIPSRSAAGRTIKPPVTLKGVPTVLADLGLSGLKAEVVPKTFTSTDVWEVIDSTEGEGVLSFCAVEQSTNTSSRSIDARLIIDGNIVWTQIAGWTATGDNNDAIAVIGYNVNDGAAFDYVRFNKGWSLQVQATTATGSVTMNGYIRSQNF